MARVAAGLATLVDGGVIAPGRLVAAGVSRGGLVASLLGATPAVAGVVAFAPVTWLGDLPAFRAVAAAAGNPATPPAAASPPGVAATMATTTTAAAVAAPAVTADAVAGNGVAIAALAAKPVRYYTGNRDVLARTRGAFEVVEALADAAHAAGVRSPPAGAELICYCSIGKDGHGTPEDIFLDGAAWVRSTLGLSARPRGWGGGRA